MLRGTLRIAAFAAAAVLSITLVSGDAFARPGGGGGRGGHAGGFHPGGGFHGGAARGFHGGGPGFHGGAVGRGFHGGAVAARFHGGVVGRPVVRGGGYRVGNRYHGGVWYGTGRHFWNGRWYSYGVGRVLALEPDRLRLDLRLSTRLGHRDTGERAFTRARRSLDAQLSSSSVETGVGRSSACG